MHAEAAGIVAMLEKKLFLTAVLLVLNHATVKLRKTIARPYVNTLITAFVNREIIIIFPLINSSET